MRHRSSLTPCDPATSTVGSARHRFMPPPLFTPPADSSIAASPCSKVPRRRGRTYHGDRALAAIAATTLSPQPAQARRRAVPLVRRWIPRLRPALAQSDDRHRLLDNAQLHRGAAGHRSRYRTIADPACETGAFFSPPTRLVTRLCPCPPERIRSTRSLHDAQERADRWIAHGLGSP